MSQRDNLNIFLLVLLKLAQRDSVRGAPRRATAGQTARAPLGLDATPNAISDISCADVPSSLKHAQRADR